MQGLQEAHEITSFDFEIMYYLSGPMAGYPEHNFPAFTQACRDLRGLGIQILSPHEVEHVGLSGQPDEWAEYLRNDVEEMIKYCKGLILLKGWPQSKGARMELGIALDLGWPVYYYDAQNYILTNMNRAKDA